MLGRRPKRLLRTVDLARAHARFAETLRQLPGPGLVGRQRGGDVERALVQSRGLLVGELHDGPLRRPRRVDDRALGAALGRRLQEVVGDLGEVRLEVVGVGLLQRLGHDEVQVRAARGAERFEQRVAHERVGEAEAAGIAPGEDDPPAQRQLECCEDRAGGLVQRVRQRLQAKLAADHRGGAERLHDGRVQRREAAADRVAHAVWQRQRALGGAGVVQPALRGEQLHELVDEERVAGAGVMDRRDEPRCDLVVLATAEAAGAHGGEPAHLVAVQPLQGQARGRAREAAERRREIRAGVRLGVAVGGDRQQRHVGQGARDELERQQRRRVGPVQVVEDDDERLVLGGGRQQRREGVEEPEAGLVGVQVGGLRWGAQRLAELGQQAGDPRRARTERVAQLRRVTAAGQGAADLHPRPVGRRAAAIPAAAPRPGRAARGCVLDELACQGGLADPRLAGQQDQAAATGEGAVEGPLELRKLAAAPHQA